MSSSDRGPGPDRASGRFVGRLSTWSGLLFRRTVLRGRFVIAALWVAAAVVVSLFAPSHPGSGGGFGDLLPSDSPVLAAEQHALELFSVPVLSGTTVVVHQPGGLDLLTRADSLLWAAGTTQRVLESPTPPGPGNIQAAIPIPTGNSEVAVTYLYMTEGTGLHNSVRLANEYAAHFDNQASVRTYVTGFVPAQVAQGDYLRSRLGLFELASVLLILVVVAVVFRSLLAPLTVLGIAGVGFCVYFPLLSTLASVLGFSVPDQLEPVLLALLLGVVTDYCVLFFSTFRDQLDSGLPPRDAAARTLRSDAPVVAVAGLTVAAGTIALAVAPFEIFRGLGPALALTVLVGLLLCLTLTPALMTIFSWRLFTVVPVRGSRRSRTARRQPAGAGGPGARRPAGAVITALTRRPVAAGAVAVVIALLALAALPVGQARLDLSFVSGLPKGDSVSQGARLLGEAGLRGISAPTAVLVEQPGLSSRRAELTALQKSLEEQPGVARVLGPDDNPTTKTYGLVLSRDGHAARFVVILDTDPLAGRAIAELRELQNRLPALTAQAGLGGAVVTVTGQTVLASTVAQLTRESLEVVVAQALGLELLILICYLRALVAPLVLLLSSTLSVAAALGLTTFVFQDVLAGQGLTFYAPFASAVLLIALGADYTVFSVGSIWHEARSRPLVEALRSAVPRTSKAITTAGVILAATFALVSIIPLSTFRQIAFAMTVGLLMDTLVVRPILTPATLTLLGRAAGWPGRRITTGPRAARRVTR